MRYTRQPQTNAPLDLSSSLTRGLGGIVVGPSRLEYIQRHIPNSTSTGTITKAPGKFGLARTFTRASAAQDVYDTNSFSGDLTVFLVGGITASIASEQRVVASQAGTTKRFWLGENSNNNLSFVTNPSGGSEVTISTGGVGDAVYVGRLSGTTMTLWKDGVQVSTNTQAVSNWSDSTKLYIGNTSFLANPGANVYLAGFATRAWTDLEIAAFSINPWQLFALPTARRFAPSAGGTQTFSYTPVGGLQFGGTSSEIRGIVRLPTGGLQFGGTAPKTSTSLQSQTVTCSGGLQFSGTSAEVRSATRSCSNGIVFGGTVAVVYFPDTAPTARPRKRGRRPRMRIY